MVLKAANNHRLIMAAELFESLPTGKQQKAINYLIALLASEQQEIVLPQKDCGKA